MQAKDRRFLRELAPDKDYLEKMVSTLSGSKEFLVHGRKRDVAIHVSSNVNPSLVPSLAFIHSIGWAFFQFQAQLGLDFLIGRRDFWSKQKPDYPTIPVPKTNQKPPEIPWD